MMARLRLWLEYANFVFLWTVGMYVGVLFILPAHYFWTKILKREWPARL